MEARQVALEALSWLEDAHPVVALGALGGSAFLEYVVPPIPGDAITVAGGVLAARGALWWPVVLVVLTTGSLLGSVAMWGVGRLSHRSKRVRWLLDRFLPAARFAEEARRYQRYGRGLVLANRFLPGLRITFLVLAGVFGMPLGEVLLLGGLSALLWNGLLVLAGFVLGRNLDEVFSFFEALTTGGWIVVGTGVVVFVAVVVVRRLRARRQKNTGV
jgi:membrane protein DedA with SNARE-associated domain